MNPDFNVERVLLFYDVPQVIALRDDLMIPYLGFLLDDEKANLPYIVTPMRPDAFDAVLAGRLTYWEGLQPSRGSQCYVVDAVDHNLATLLVRRSLPFSDVPDDYWPEEWAYLFQEEQGEAALSSEYARQGPVLVELAFDPPSQGVTIGRFSELVSRLHLWVKAIAGQQSSARQLLNIAVPARAGSFKVLLEQSHDLGALFPSSVLSTALTEATELIRNADNHDFLATYFHAHQEAATPFKEFVQAVKRLDTGVTLRWEAEGSDTHTASASRYSVLSLEDWLTGKYNRETVEVIYRGTFVAMDLEKGTWRLSDPTTVSGTTSTPDAHDVRGKTAKESRHLLRDLTSGGVYIFTCSELQTLDPLTSEPMIERTLVKVEDGWEVTSNEGS